MKNSIKSLLALFFLVSFFCMNTYFETKTNENKLILNIESQNIKADFKKLPQGQIGCVTANQEPGIMCIDNNNTCPNDRLGCVSVLQE